MGFAFEPCSSSCSALDQALLEYFGVDSAAKSAELGSAYRRGFESADPLLDVEGLGVLRTSGQ